MGQPHRQDLDRQSLLWFASVVPSHRSFPDSLQVSEVLCSRSTSSGNQGQQFMAGFLPVQRLLIADCPQEVANVFSAAT